MGQPGRYNGCHYATSVPDAIEVAATPETHLAVVRVKGELERFTLG